MQIYNILEKEVKKGMNQIFQVDIPTVDFQETVKDFEGDLTILIFPFLRYVKGNPAEIATKLAEYLMENVEEITSYNVVKGFLNISLSDRYFLKTFQDMAADPNFGITETDPEANAVMVEYSS
ncbi:MAG: arginine--tRNA ligase, partial [Lutimonas sp.]